MSSKYDHLIGKFAKLKSTRTPREEAVAGMYGTIADIYGEKANVVFLLTSTLGTKAEYGVFVEIERLDISEVTSAGKAEDIMEFSKTNNVNSLSDWAEGTDRQEVYHFLQRQANRFTAWLVYNGYKRYAASNGLPEGTATVWATSPSDALRHISELTGSHLYTVEETQVTKGVSFEQGDRFIENTQVSLASE